MNQGSGAISTVVGAVATIALGVLGVAALFQLDKPGGQTLVKTGGTVATTTVNKVFS